MAAEKSRPLTRVVFEPFIELDLNRDLDLMPASSNVSIARQKFVDDSEAAINEQINFKRDEGVPAIFTNFCEEVANLAACCIISVTKKAPSVHVQLNPFRQPLAVEDSTLYLPLLCKLLLSLGCD